MLIDPKPHRNLTSGRGNAFPRARADVSRSPFERGHPATPRCRTVPEFFQRIATRALLRCSVPLPRRLGRCAPGDGSGVRAFRRLGRNIARSPATFRPDRALAQASRSTPAARASAVLADSVSPLSDGGAVSNLHLRAARFAPRQKACSTGFARAGFMPLKRREAFGRSLSLRRSRPSLGQQSRALWAASL